MAIKEITKTPTQIAPATQLSKAAEQMRVGGSHKDTGKVHYGAGMMRY